MAFKMKGFPKQTGIGGVQAEKDLASELKEDKPKKTKTKEPTMTYEEWAKTAPGTARWLSKEQYDAEVNK